LPLSTLSEAHTRAQSGDTIHVLTGTLTTGLTVTKDNLTIEGDGTDSLIQVSSGCPLNITADYCTVRRLTLVSTEVSSAGIGIDVDTTVGTTIEQVSATGPFDGIQGVNSVRLTLRRCAFNSNFDGGTLTGASRLHASDCIFSTDATYAGASAHHGMIIDGDAVFERSTFQSMRTVAGSIRQSAFERSANATAQPRFVDCTFITSATHASNTGVVNGISEQYTAGVPSQDLKATILGGSINVVNSGSGATRIISATRAASLVRLLNVQFDKTTLHESAAGANVKWLDDPLNDWLDGGRLDLILDARASQASVDDLPTNSELSTALAAADDAVLVAIDALPTNSELATALAAADDAVLTAVGTITAKLPSKTYLTGTNNSDGDIQLDEATGTVNATIEQAAIDAIVDDMWDEDETGHTTANTFGKELQDLESRLTTTRAGYLDNLNVGGAVASASSLSTVASAVTTISNKLGSWTGTGIETVLGAFRAMFRKDASVSVPTDINSGGGSANNTTDSLEAIRDRGDAAWGGGGGGGDPLVDFDNTPIVANRVFKLGSRRDGVAKAQGVARYKPSEHYPVWIDTTRYGGGQPIRTVSGEAFTGDGFTLTSARKNRELIVVWLDSATGVDGDTGVVTVTFQNQVGEAIIAELDTEII
jgi:hypothetical protein